MPLRIPQATLVSVWFALAVPAACAADAPQRASADAGLFARTNLVAWCIVPFDAKKRGPEERAAMLEKLGVKLFAYVALGKSICNGARASPRSTIGRT